jgi:hypothetical protein
MIDKKIIVIALTTIGASLGMVSTFSWMESFRPYLISIGNNSPSPMGRNLMLLK